MKKTLLALCLLATTISAHATQIIEFNSGNIISYDLTETPNIVKQDLIITYRNIHGGQSTLEKRVRGNFYTELNLALHEMVTKKTVYVENGSCIQKSLMLDTKSGYVNLIKYSVKCK